jgi:hypothetical protein
MSEWYEQDVMMTAFTIGTSRVQVASKSIFTAGRDEIEIVALWCHGERFPNTKENPIGWDRKGCGKHNCDVRRSRKKAKGENVIPYYDIKVAGNLLRHVMLVIKERRCNRCEKWHESESFGAFCSEACKQKAWESKPDRETSTAGPLTGLNLTT